jgi:hypothetical protein
VAVPIIRVPLLDKICSLINAEFPRADGTVLESLCTSTTNQNDATGGLTGTVTLSQAALLTHSADGATDDQIETVGLTFKTSLGVDDTLPLLYRSFDIKFSWDFSSVFGAAVSFQPE